MKEYGEKQIGCSIPFNNKHGTCWLISILVIFFYGDSSSTCVQHKLNTTIINEENIILLNYILPNDIVKQYYDKQRNIEEEFINLMNKLQHIYRIKRADELKLSTSEDSTPKHRQVLSDELETDFTKLFILLLDDTHKQRKIDTQNRYGVNIQHEFFLVNILSCLFLNRLIEFKYFAVNTLIDIDLLKNTIGILIHMNGHLCSFYICNNTMKFCNNHKIIDYNWLALFNKCNELKNENYNIYMEKGMRTGPFIYSNNTKYYFNRLIPYEERVSIDDSDIENYRIIYGFNYLSYYNNADYSNFKKETCGYYLKYYTYLNNIEKYIEFINECRIDNNNINNTVLYNINLLTVAYDKNQKDIFNYLLSLNINLNMQTLKSNTILYKVCEKGDYTTLDLLLTKSDINIDVNLKNEIGDTPLHVACANGHSRVVDLLTKSDIDIDVNLKNEIGDTPLHVACANGHSRVVDLLTKSDIDIDVNLKNEIGDTPLHVACANGHSRVVDLLTKSDIDIDVNLKNEIGDTPLHVACYQGYKNKSYGDIVNLLTNKSDIDVNLTNANGDIALHIACNLNLVKIFKILVNKLDKKDINIIDKNGNTSLHIACAKGHYNIVESIINKMDKKKDIHIKDKDGNTALHIACANGYNNIVELLLNKIHDINVNIRNNTLNTPLHLACVYSRNEVIRSLLKLRQSININLQNELSNTPLDIVTMLNNNEMVQLLTNRL